MQSWGGTSALKPARTQALGVPGRAFLPDNQGVGIVLPCERRQGRAKVRAPAAEWDQLDLGRSIRC